MKRAVIWCAVSTKAQADDERESLPAQEAEARAICEANGWQVSDVLIVPGHSRRYNNLYKCADEMRAAGIDALDRLIAHWEKQDFDVLVCRDGNRFARKQGMHATIVEEIIDNGAVIYSVLDGLVDQRNFRFFISMNGYKAAAEIDELNKKRELGYQARARRGLPVNSKVATSHLLVRDALSGKAIKIVVDESKRRMWLDLAELLLQGVAWRQIERDMFDRFGHANPLGEPFQHHHFYRIMHTPTFWGHTARHFKYAERGMWTIEPDHPLPAGVTIHYNTHEAIYAGELAVRVKAEMVRRQTVIRGSASPDNTKRFTGLFLCAECGYGMAFTESHGWMAYQCLSKYERSSTRSGCTVTRRMPDKKAQQQIDRMLRQIVASQSLDLLYTSSHEDVSASQQLELIRQDIQTTENTLRKLIVQHATADAAIQALYDQEIQAATEKLKTLKLRQRDLQQQQQPQHSAFAALQTLHELTQMTMDVFWQQDDRVVNQMLHSLLAGRRFVVQEAVIRGTTIAPKRKKRY